MADVGTARLGIRRRIVVAHGGRLVASSVFCPEHLQSTHVDVCRRCSRAVCIDDASVTCVREVGSPRFESAVGSAMGGASVAIEAVVPIVELTRLPGPGGWVAVVVVLDADHRSLGLIDREQLAGAEPSTPAGALARPLEPLLESSPVMSAVRRMVRERARALPVVDAMRSAVGLLTDLDALRWAAAFQVTAGSSRQI